MAGSGIQNSQCQLRCSSISPPTTSPKPPPTPRMADISPMLPDPVSGKLVPGDRERQREDAARHSLDDAGHDQDRQRTGQRPEQSSGGKSQQGPHQQPLLTVHVAELADDRRTDRGREQEPSQQPGDTRLAGMKAARSEE